MPRRRAFALSAGRILLVGVVSLSLFVNACPGRAAAAPPTGTQPTTATTSQLASIGLAVSSDGWISYTKSQASSLGLSGLTSTTVAGTRDTDGSCVSTATDADSAAGTYTEEVAFNPTTCASRYLSGTITPTAAAKLATIDGASDGLATATTAGPASTTGATPQAASRATSYRSSHTVTKWIDPVNITITRQAINLKWLLYGAGGTLSSSWPAYKFAYDGWSVSGPHFSGFKKLSNDAGWYVNADSHFTNYDFAALVYFLLGLAGWLACGAHLTTRADFYHNVQVTGHRSGYSGHHWSDKKSGACSNLVHHATSNGLGWY